MAPELLKAFFRAGVFVTGTSVFLLFIVKPDTAEFVITILSICIGITLLALVALVSWFVNR
jgi:preprotein translocase subunit Sss1